MQSKSFQPAPNSIDFSKNDHLILKFWEERDIFKKTERVSRLGKNYVFYDGPPGTNGRPHIGHIMQSSLKDVWPRFKTMQGYTVLRKAGWDTHGLPVELTAEAELGLSGKVEIEKFGTHKFIEHCRNTVLRFRSDWVDAIRRLGRFLDCENDYLTMSNDFIQSDWWVMRQAFDKQLLYKDFKIVPYCARCGTGLSSHEVAQGYQDVTDLTITAKFALHESPNTFVLAWTTTPWTLLGNVALCVGAEIEYSKVQVLGARGPEFLILASALLEKNKKALGKDYTVVETFPGSALVGKSYAPLWDFSAQVPNPQNLRMHVVVADEYVTTDDGTGVVHLALYGEDDFRLIKKYGLVQNQHVLADGHCGPHCGPFQGRFFREEGFDVDIVKDLAARGLLFDKYRHEHSYPHCWRCKTGLMYFAKSSWFLKTTALKETMLAENAKIHWQPPHIRDGRFGNWLENNVDWAISRERYWGSPINIWTSTTNPHNQLCPASVAELRSLGAYFRSTGQLIGEDFDLHISTVDDIEIKREGEVYRREVGVLDCWFNAGIMPWGQFGYPAKPGSKELFESQFPADFICEAIDQTRGWFYTLIAASCLVAGRSSFKNVICTEHVLDVQGKKMSKSLGNVIAPLPLIEQFGADAVRWTFYDSNPWLPKRYSDELPREALRTIFIPLWNCYSFFVTYANLDKWAPGAERGTERSELDRWILSALRTTLVDVTKGLEAYDIATAAIAIRDFIDVLSNWYIRRSRKRFWRSENDADKGSAYATLYEVLVTLSKVIAPLAPFVAETIYQNLVRSFEPAAPESVHLSEWPSADRWAEERELEEEVAAIQEAAALARALRTEHDLKVRQPLSELMVTPSDSTLGKRLHRHVESLAEEVNVKEVILVENAAEFVDFSIKPNWKVLGPRFGNRMKDVNGAIQRLSPLDVSTFVSSGKLNLNLGAESIELVEGDLGVEHKAKPGLVARSGRRVTVALKTELTPTLVAEGNAREIVSVVQKQRKNLSFEISDHIYLRVWGDGAIQSAIETHGAMIARECLARSVDFVGASGDADTDMIAVDINGHTMHLGIRKA